MKCKKLIVLVGLVAVMLMSTTSTAFAQQQNDDAFALAVVGGTYGMMTTTTLAPITTVAGVIVTIVMIINSQNEQVTAYLQDNPVAVQHDLYIGGGESTRDLAEIFGVPEGQLAQFGDILYDNRDALAALTAPGNIDENVGRQFTEIVVEDMLENEAMAVALAEQQG